MKSIFLSSALLFLLCESLGLWFFEKLHLKEGKGAALAGFAGVLAFCQILYYPVQLLHGSFFVLVGITVTALLLAAVILVRQWKRVWAQLLRPRTLVLGLDLIIFLIVFYLCYLDQEFGDSPMYLNYIAQNIENPHINLFNLYTGETGAEWDPLYLYQGYYHFNSVYVWLLNRVQSVDTLKAVVWGMGILYALMSGELFLDILDAFPVRSRFFRISLTAFVLFYLNFYYWRIITSFYGNTWRTLWITFSMFLVYEALKRNELPRCVPLLSVIGFAGCACSSSYLFCSFAMLSILAAHLFITQKEHVFVLMSRIVLPLVIYAGVMLYKDSHLFLLLDVFFLFYYGLLYAGRLNKGLAALDRLVEKHARLLFYVLIPGAAALASFLYMRRYPDYLYGYAYFFNNHQNNDMVKDYFFVYSTWPDNIVNALRWAGVIALLCSKKEEDAYLKDNIRMMLLVFMNPLCTPILARYISSNVFYRAWEVMFNPFMEIVLLVRLMQAVSRPAFEKAMAGTLAAVTAVTNVQSLSGDISSNYGFYIQMGKVDYDHILKMQPEALDAIENLRSALAEDNITDRQPIVISQAEGTRVYLPQVIQLVTARDNYYVDTRVDQDLYQIARRHHYISEDEGALYEKTCPLMATYQVDYVVDRYGENAEFDAALDACSTVIYENTQFRVRRIEN